MPGGRHISTRAVPIVSTHYPTSARNPQDAIVGGSFCRKESEDATDRDDGRTGLGVTPGRAALMDTAAGSQRRKTADCRQ